MFCDAFNAFAKSCGGHFPIRVVVYRNGVGDGQKQTLLEQEFSQIDAARNSIDKMSKCKIAYIMCNTKVKTKFVQKNGNNYDNPKCGTVLDHSVVKKDLYDFYLVSTSSR